VRLCLAAMPWLAVDTPSLAVGILRRRVNEACPSMEVSEYHGGIGWAEHLLRTTDGELTPNDYYRIADKGLGYGLGDWVFAGVLYGDERWRLVELRGHAKQWDLDLGLAERMRELAGPFVADAATELLARDVDVVGFTTTFMQTVPSLALARELKRRKPAVRIVLGGANCDGPMGAVVHRNHPFVDFVVRGEGEVAFPRLLSHIAAGTPPRDVPGVCWWDGARSVANPEATHSVAPALIPMPDYDDWFASIAASPVSEYITPFLYVEGSRGCWWGEKHQCTFCGLNGSLIDFRSKPADRFWDELTHLVERHRVLDVMTADNIIDMAYYRDLLPRMAASGWDLRLQFEAKANVRAEQIALLAAAGVCAVQYGIENLNSRVLKLMDKGVTAGTNVRVMRDSEDHHLTVKWNYLYGFPGEQPADYLTVIEQMPALAHLQPPMDACRITLERFSPYFDKPELGFASRSPASFYRYVYDLPDSELMDLAYFFDTDNHGICGATEQALVEAIAQWQRDYPCSSLFRVDEAGEALTICDRRRGWPVRDHVLDGWWRAAYQALDRPRSTRSLYDHLAEHGYEVDPTAVGAWLASCVRDGLVFVDDDTYVALATHDVPVRITPDST
jgi:ribosomal peptide maturation radical SAM protein 1